MLLTRSRIYKLTPRLRTAVLALESAAPNQPLIIKLPETKPNELADSCTIHTRNTAGKTVSPSKELTEQATKLADGSKYYNFKEGAFELAVKATKAKQADKPAKPAADPK